MAYTAAAIIDRRFMAAPRDDLRNMPISALVLVTQNYFASSRTGGAETVRAQWGAEVDLDQHSKLPEAPDFILGGAGFGLMAKNGRVATAALIPYVQSNVGHGQEGKFI